MTITTTLNRIRAHGPCSGGWRKLLAGLGKTDADDEPLPYARIVEINGIDDALWACRAEPDRAKEWRLFAVWCARSALVHTSDWRAVAAVNVAEQYVYGMATKEQLAAARDAAWAAARDAAGAAAWAAAEAARDAARDAAGAVRDAARDAAGAVRDAARDAAGAAAWDAAGAAQTKKFLEIVE